MTFITLDPYYPTSFFEETKNALKNNNVEPEVFASIKTPFNWYFKVKDSPTFVNYDNLKNSESRWLVSVVNALRPNEAYKLIRRDNDTGQTALTKFIENEPLKEARVNNYGCFFTVKNREEAEAISTVYTGKVWYLGKYYSNKYRVCLCTHDSIKNIILSESILLEKEEKSEPGRFEAELNWRVFRGNDYLVKFTETPYFFKGAMHKVKIQGELSARFVL